MKSQMFWAAAVVIALAAGIVIGRKTQSTATSSDSNSPERSGSNPNNYRSSRTSHASGSSLHGEGSTETRVGNKVKYMTKLAEELNTERGMPDFDALFGIWETARDMSPEEIKLALGEIKSLQLPQQSAMFMKAMLVMQWAKKDGASAMQYASESKGNRFFPMNEMALQAWGSSDPNGAYNWYETNKETLKPRERKRFEAQAIAALAKDNFDQAFLKAKNVDSASREEVFESLGSAVANNPEQREQLLQYLQTLEDKDTLNETGSAMARQMAMKDIQDAVEFAEKWPGENKLNIAVAVAKQWGQTEPAKAMTWQIGQLPTDVDPADAVADIFAGWARKTPDEAKNWLETKNDIDQDHLRSQAITRMRWDDNYQLSINWADEIQDEKMRLKNYKNIYSSWQQDDKEGAQHWLEAQTPELRESIVPNAK